MMKRILILFFGVILSIAANSQERIMSYDTHIVIEESGTLLVREDITVKAEGIDIRRGIYRSFPTRYKDKMGTRFNVDFVVAEVLKDGNPEPWFTEKKSNGIVLYVGDSNRMLENGIYTYSLTYRTTRQIGFFKDFDELYFNAIGGDWVFNIEKASVTIELPGGATALQMAGYTGPAGSTTCECEIDAIGNKVKISTTRALNPYEQLTFAVAWPKGFVKEPTFMEKLIFFLKNNLIVLYVLLGLALVAYLYYKAWQKVGIDPPKGTIIPLFDPPEGFSPADTAFLSRMAMTQRAFTAAIVNMAVKGYLKIIHTKKRYSLERVSTDASILTPEEQALAAELFSKGSVIELDNKHHSTFTRAQTMEHNAMQKKMKPKYFSLNTKHLGKGFLVSIGLAVVAFLISPSPTIPIIFCVLLTLLVILFSWLIKAPTPEGRALMDEIEGFKMYVNVAEKQQLDLLHEPNMTIERFEKLLPYAIALGVENQWGKKFENALAKSLQEAQSYRPAWYAGAGAMAFSPSRFSSDVGRSFSSAISSASTPPGSKSGSGGGGSSGGGGGGGGGGGW
jgi:uncharacterized membrane protein